MTETKWTEVTAINTTPISTDIILMVDDPGGTPASQKMTLATLATFINNLTGRVLIAETTPTGTGTVTWSSIAAGYKNLEIEIIGRTDKAAVATGMYLYFNNDTTAANYSRQSTTGTGTTLTTGHADNPDCILIAGNNATASYPGISRIWIPGYSATTFMKMAQVRNFNRQADTSTGSSTNLQDLLWQSANAINRIDIVTDDSSNYVAGSTFRLYGVY